MLWQNVRLISSLRHSRLFSQFIGFGMIKNRDATLKVVKSLQLYKERFNTTIIPRDFQVPTDDDEWPREMWGDKIGSRVSSFRMFYNKNLLSSHDIQLLEESGMQWEVRPLSLKLIKNVSGALHQYKVIYGNTKVPLDYKVPLEGGEWLKSQRGMALGNSIQRIRNIYFQNRLENEYFDILDSAGFIWNAINSKVVLNLVEVMKIYKKLHGTTLIPLKFIIPETELHQWPQEFQNKKVGKWLNRVRTAYHQNNLNESEITALEEAGIQWVVPSMQYMYTWVSRLVQGLEIYKKLHGGTTLVPFKFVVPSDTEDWPVELHGHRLGKVVSQARYDYQRKTLSEQDISALEEAGIEWLDPSAKYRYTWVSRLAQGLEVYNELHGTTLVPHNFVVPSIPEEWPVELHGHKLGSALRQARKEYKKKNLSEQDISKLEKMGIQWVAPSAKYRYTWVSRLAQGLEVYKNLHSTTLVPHKFVVPSNAEEWPVELHGHKLGSALSQARNRKARLTQSDIEDLNSAGIVWKTQTHLTSKLETV